MPKQASLSRRNTKPAESDLFFDAHCHVLNLEYLILETVQILWDMVRGAYPLPTESAIEKTVAIRPSFELRYPFDAVQTFMAWLIGIGRAAFQSEVKDVKDMRRAAHRAWKTENLGLVPLMMDIYFMFAPPLGPEGPSPEARHEPTAPLAKDKRDEYARAFRKRITQVVQKVHGRMSGKTSAARERSGRLEAFIASFAERVLSGKAQVETAGAPGFKTTAGFLRQFNAVAPLGAKGSGVYPFFAVDARREGVVDWVINGGQVGPGGPFYGIKLYPRLGCHPGRRELEPLFEFCARRRIPITAHASGRGFPHWIMSFAEYGNPRNYRPIFEKYPGIKINMAHFGDKTEDLPGGDEWALTIAGLMRDFPGAYSDLSCYTSYKAIERYISRCQDLPNVRERTMFGSDYNVLFFTEPGMTLEKYYRRFLDVFGDERLRQMTSDVPRAFLGI